MKKLVLVGNNLYRTVPILNYGSYIVGHLLVRPTGNILVDCPCNILQYQQHLKELGGVRKLYFSHSHKTLPSDILEYFKNKGVKIERPGLWNWNLKQKFIEKKEVDSDLNVLYTPGHTSDSVIVQWIDQGVTRWFTGETVFMWRNQLTRSIQYSDDNAQLNQTLEFLKDHVVDWIYPSRSDTLDSFKLNITSLEKWKHDLTRCQKQF